MSDPLFTVGARVLIVGNTPWSGSSGEVQQVNPAGYLSGIYAGQHYYNVRLDNGQRSIQTERNLTAVEPPKRKRSRR